MMDLTLEQRFHSLEAVNIILAKAMGISEVSQIARLEKAMREWLVATWKAKVKEAAQRVAAAIQDGATLEQAMNIADKIFETWAKEIEATYLSKLEDVYKLASVVGNKKATKKTKISLQYGLTDIQVLKKAKTKPGKKPSKLPKPVTPSPMIPTPSMKPSFDLKDKKALTALKKREVYWIGEHYEKDVQDAIRETAKEIISSGEGATAAASDLWKKLSQAMNTVATPKGYIGMAEDYFAGVVANAVTNSRVQGQLRSFEKVDIQKYIIVNPLDERTCPVCSQMNDVVFSVQGGIEQADLDSEATSPDEIKDAHPWLGEDEIKGKSPDELSDAGFSLPPFHFNCRCTVDVAD